MPILDFKKTKFSEIYLEYYSIVYCSIFSRINNEVDAEELTQEVFIRFYINFEKINDHTKIKSWLFGTLKNILFEYYRSKKKMSQQMAYEEVFDDVALTFVNGFKETRIIIDEAIENLDTTERKIFDLVAVRNFSYNEAGNLLGMTKSKVRYMYNNIARKVINNLNNKGIKQIEDLL